MRSDYGLYVVAVICFIIAGVFLTGAVTVDTMNTAAIVIFLILGIIFAIGGYVMKPKVAVPTTTLPPPTLTAEPSPPAPAVEEKVEEAPSAPPTPEPEPQPIVEEAPTPAQAPTPTAEEPTEAEEEKPAEKPVRRRGRKKKTA
jgi:protein TonB